jgi:hypothetical protein
VCIVGGGTDAGGQPEVPVEVKVEVHGVLSLHDAVFGDRRQMEVLPSGWAALAAEVQFG